MTKQEVFLSHLLDNGLVDIRKMAVVANAKVLPSGEFGLCLLCLNNNVLSVYNTDFHQNIGEKLYEIDLQRVSNFKASSFVFNRYMKFTYNSFYYKFADFGNAKAFIEAVTSEMSK
jgi:hypothetical protein